MGNEGASLTTDWQIRATASSGSHDLHVCPAGGRRLGLRQCRSAHERPSEPVLIDRGFRRFRRTRFVDPTHGQSTSGCWRTVGSRRHDAGAYRAATGRPRQARQRTPPWTPCTLAGGTPYIGQGTGSCRVRGDRRITCPSSITSSTTSADSPEVMASTREFTSLTRHQRHRSHIVTTDSVTEPVLFACGLDDLHRARRQRGAEGACAGRDTGGRSGHRRITLLRCDGKARAARQLPVRWPLNGMGLSPRPWRHELCSG